MNRLKRKKADELKLANPDRAGTDDLSQPVVNLGRRESTPFQIFKGIDQLPKVLV